MGSARRFTLGMAAIALLVGGLGSAAAQGGNEDAINSRVDPQVKGGWRASKAAEPAATLAPVTEPEQIADKAPDTLETSPTPAEPASPSPGGPENPATPATPATPTTSPLGLSRDAPDTAPSIGVIGRGSGKGAGNRAGRDQGKSRGSSPAATPEPSTLLLMGAGLVGLYRLRRRR